MISKAKAVAGFGFATLLALCAAIAPFYPGSAPAVAVFLASGTIFGCVCVIKRPSFYVLIFAAFLIVGFVVKLLANLTFGQKLIEPVGSFNGQWDQALYFASAGFVGCALAVLVCSQFPSFALLRRDGVIAGRTWLLRLTIGLLTLAAIGVYVANYKLTILRIGFPLGVELDPKLYAVLAFVITWGALLGVMAVCTWIIDSHGWASYPLIIAAAVLGFFASVTMGSRIQLLLYVLSAFLVVVFRWREGQYWKTLASLLFAGIVFLASLSVVSIERFFDFNEEPEMQLQGRIHRGDDEANTLEKMDAIASGGRIGDLIGEIENLVIMRWVGIEGVMTTAGAQDRLGLDLLSEAMVEAPAAGTNGIYQRMAGDFYAAEKYYTFLTIPGPIGIASYSGNLAVIAGFMFVVTLAGHAIEWAMAWLTRNIGAVAVSGVSLAYLTVQMAFPKTLMFYFVELLLAGVGLGCLRLLLTRGQQPIPAHDLRGGL